MQLSELTRPYLEVCDNCHKEIIAYKSEDRLIKFQCPHCGAVTVTSFKSRNHFVKDVRRPKR